MDEDLKAQTKNQDAIHREMKRRSLDTIRVYNPLDKDKTVIWDGFPHVVKAHNEVSWPRYLAEKATTEIVVELINTQTAKQIDEEMKRRSKAGLKAFDTYEKNVEIVDKLARTNNEELLKKYYPLVWLGLETEYGMDYGGETPDQPFDNRTVQERILDSLDKKYEPEQPAAVNVTAQPVAEANLASEVTNDKG